MLRAKLFSLLPYFLQANGSLLRFAVAQLLVEEGLLLPPLINIENDGIVDDLSDFFRFRTTIL